jgi:hypothetical protein
VRIKRPAKAFWGGRPMSVFADLAPDGFQDGDVAVRRVLDRLTGMMDRGTSVSQGACEPGTR